jgi:hypothetical protein
MLARRSTLSHPTAGNFDLPLLVPAFSSKGFALRKTRKGRPYSEVSFELKQFSEFPQDSALVSAYDLYFGHFCAPKLDREPEAYLRNTQLIFVDSGGYELVQEFDSTEPKSFPHSPRAGEYGPEQYQATLKRLLAADRPLNLVVTNFDHGGRGRTLSEQVEAARAVFVKCPGCATDFLLKPTTPKGDVVDVDDLPPRAVESLRGFDVIGVTEKELGKNLIDRLGRIARLRRLLDRARITAPIHVWGGLDPLVTPLYFFAGAAVFDGVSWLRYAYHNGVAMCRSGFPVLSSLGVTANSQYSHFYASLENLTVLRNLGVSLGQWVDYDGARFDMFAEGVAEGLRVAYEAMVSKIDELKEER